MARVTSKVRVFHQHYPIDSFMEKIVDRPSREQVCDFETVEKVNGLFVQFLVYSTRRFPRLRKSKVKA